MSESMTMVVKKPFMLGISITFSKFYRLYRINIYSLSSSFCLVVHTCRCFGINFLKSQHYNCRKHTVCLVNLVRKKVQNPIVLLINTHTHTQCSQHQKSPGPRLHAAPPPFIHSANTGNIQSAVPLRHSESMSDRQTCRAPQR